MTRSGIRKQAYVTFCTNTWQIMRKRKKFSTRKNNGWRRVGHFLTKLNILLPCGPAIAFLGIYPNELKLPSTHTNLHKSL